MISGVVLARNEAANIVDCLEALRPHVGEIILIDMVSDDATVELSRPLVDKVLSHPLVAAFDAARNIAIQEARHDWLWFVDADERISERTGEIVNQLIREKGETFESLIIPFKSYFCGQWMQHCGWWPGYTMPRVLKRGHFQFAKRLHAGVELNGRQISLPPDPDLAIDHFSYRSIEHYLEKLNRYTSTEALQLAERGGSFDWREAIRHMTADLWGYYEGNQGKRDGELGWILSWLSGQYRWLTHAKLADRIGQPTSTLPSVPNDLDEVLDVMRDQLATMRKQAPQLPLGIVWRSPVWDPSGYADECRTFLKALSRGERPLRLEDIRWSSQECELPEAERALLQSLTRAERPRSSVAITDCIPTTCAPDPLASLNILRTTFETDRIPEYWLPALEQYDEIWVTSHHNCHTFRRAGVAPEKLFAVQSCVDTDRYRPDGPQLDLPGQLQGKFIFLSVFDWAFRKGWDLLLKAYCQTFRPEVGTGLLLKLTRSHLHPLSFILQQAEELLASFGQSLQKRPDIVISDAILDAESMSAMYRTVQAFVLASRGEGWGRPYIEAMASGLPTIGTRATGNIDFMDDTNSYLIDATEVDIPEDAAREIPVYRGHRWYEPNITTLQTALRTVFEDEPLRKVRSRKAVADIQTKFGLAAGRQAIETALAAAEQRFANLTPRPAQPQQIRVELEGEFFACHSFSKVNEQIAKQLIASDEVALSLNRCQQQHALDQTNKSISLLRPYIGRHFDGGPEIIIRHYYPPDWTPPPQGKWVHIQPWEYGRLPQDWVGPLRDRVDEIWAPSNYVKQVYVDSGVPAEKIQVIPWGVDPIEYSPNVPARILPTTKRFAFLFVGGTIARKGFDLLLDAYLKEFGPHEDVCLVVKDIGATSFYRDSTHQAAIRQAMADAANPEILYFDELLTEGQLASLYAACQCFVAPYRGEGFGLPILEAMACGLAPMVPRGGASDDFVTEQTGIMLPAELIQEEYRADFDCRPSHLEVSPTDLRRAMRRAFEDRVSTSAMGKRASEFARSQFTWQRTASLIGARLRALTTKHLTQEQSISDVHRSSASLVAACIITHVAELQLADCLARLRPFVDQIIVCDRGSTDRTEAIAREYSAEVIRFSPHDSLDSIQLTARKRVHTAWWCWTDVGSLANDRDLEELRDALTSQSSAIDQVNFRLSRSKRADGSAWNRVVVARTDADANLVNDFFPKREQEGSNGSDRPATKPYGRTVTIDKALSHFKARQGRLIVEIGSIRERGNIHGDGYSTVAWAQHAEKVYSVDTDPKATALTQEETAEFGNVLATTRDGVEFLDAFNQPIDLLYLDAWDAHSPGSQDNHLRAYLAARKNLHLRSLILIDDTDLGDQSKGRLIIPQAESDGWNVLFSEGKQTLLGRP